MSSTRDRFRTWYTVKFNSRQISADSRHQCVFECAYRHCIFLAACPSFGSAKCFCLLHCAYSIHVHIYVIITYTDLPLNFTISDGFGPLLVCVVHLVVRVWVCGLRAGERPTRMQSTKPIKRQHPTDDGGKATPTSECM